MSVVVVAVVVTALLFDFTNGFHDTANAMATSIATGALKPRVAVAVSAVLNLVGAFLSVGTIHMGASTWLLAHCVLFAIWLAELTRYGSQLYHYRRGA